MRRPSLLALCLLTACGSGHRSQRELVEADLRSGPDGKRSGAQMLRPNRAHTDEISFRGQDRTDWYAVMLRGRPGVLTTQIHWDNEQSDVMIDVFDEFGQQVAASPIRGRGDKQKRLLTQIDKLGQYYIRVTAPGRQDSTVYTVEAQWEEPQEMAPVPIVTDDLPPMRMHEHHARAEKPEKPEKPRESAETIQGRILSVYREGGGLTLHLDKGAAAGVRVGQNGTVLSGPSGEDALEGGTFHIVQVLDDHKSIAKTTLHAVGKNNRVMITLGK